MLQIAIYTLTTILLVALLLWNQYRHDRQMKQKNQVIVSQHERISVLVARVRDLLVRMDRLRMQHEEMKPTDDENNITISGNENNRQLFIKMDRMIVGDKLYLNPDFRREDVTRMLGVNNNRLNKMFQENMSYSTLPTYLNNLRVSYACQLLVEHPQWAVRAVAKESGFATVRRFHTVFKEQTGMTPSEYRDAETRKSELG